MNADYYQSFINTIKADYPDLIDAYTNDDGTLRLYDLAAAYYEIRNPKEVDHACVLKWMEA